MLYQIRIRRAAQKQLDKITGQEYKAIHKAVSTLSKEPRPRGVEKLAESGLWRIRIRQHRVVYFIDDDENQIIVVRVARRTEGTYRNL